MGRSGPYSVVIEADSSGVSTLTVESKVKSLGADIEIFHAEASGICADLNHEVCAIRDLSVMGQLRIFFDVA